MKELGRTCFPKTAYINFDNNERMKSVFEGSLEPSRLIQAFNAETGIDITAGDTLIILDEIQEVPRALTSLKYFNENAPEYAVIAAGPLNLKLRCNGLATAVLFIKFTGQKKAVFRLLHTWTTVRSNSI